MELKRVGENILPKNVLPIKYDTYRTLIST